MHLLENKKGGLKMRKAVLVITVISLLISLSAVAEEKKSRLYVGVTAGYLMPDFSYSSHSWLLGVDYSGQYNIYTNPTFGTEVGIRLTDHISFYTGYSRFLGHLNAKYDFSIQINPFQPLSITLTEGKVKYEISQFGICYNFGGNSAINPYVRGGFLYIKGNIELPDLIVVDMDTFTYTASFADISFAGSGGTIGGGVDYRLSRHFGITLNADYLYAKTNIPDQLTSTEFEVKLGGIHISGGVRFYF
jgi:hypothetical protein